MIVGYKPWLSLSILQQMKVASFRPDWSLYVPKTSCTRVLMPQMAVPAGQYTVSLHGPQGKLVVPLNLLFIPQTNSKLVATNTKKD